MREVPEGHLSTLVPRTVRGPDGEPERTLGVWGVKGWVDGGRNGG